MFLTGLDFVLMMTVSYLTGVGTGLTICCHYKEKFMSNNKNKIEYSDDCVVACEKEEKPTQNICIKV